MTPTGIVLGLERLAQGRPRGGERGETGWGLGGDEGWNRRGRQGRAGWRAGRLGEERGGKGTRAQAKGRPGAEGRQWGLPPRRPRGQGPDVSCACCGWRVV